LALLTAAGFCLLALVGPYLVRHPPTQTDTRQRLTGPSATYPLGNDHLGRCLYSRIVAGARSSVGIGLLVVAAGLVPGVLIGLLAGYLGGMCDNLLMRITDIFLTIPEILAAMTLAGLLGPSTANLIFALGAVGWMRYARVIRGQVLSLRQRDYVKAARLCGRSTAAIFFWHILPACLSSITVLATVGLSKSILAVSSLGFLGFGVQPPHPEWGTLLMDGKRYLLVAPHLSIFPGLVVMASVLAFNLSGDALSNWWRANDQAPPAEEGLQGRAARLRLRFRCLSSNPVEPREAACLREDGRQVRRSESAI
jgi:peptide/nickel transport system permease protein